MTVVDILLLLRAAGETVRYLSGLAAQLQSEGRGPTPEEMEQVKARQREAEMSWQALLPATAPPARPPGTVEGEDGS